MKLTVLGSNSSGNSYVLHNNNEALIIEAGIKFSDMQKAIDYKTDTIKGLLISHEHGDHSKYVSKYLDRGIKVYTSKGTIDALELKGLNMPERIEALRPFKVGNFKVMAFKTIHDCREPLGFLINHPESGNILFLTDSAYSPFKFKNISHFIVETNYVTDVVKYMIETGKLEPFRLNRLARTHMSLETCKDLLNANDLSSAQNIICIHLSKQNSNYERIYSEISQEFGIPTWIANKGLSIELSNYNETNF